MSDADTTTCPRGHITSAKFPFCTECGAELTSESNVPPPSPPAEEITAAAAVRPSQRRPGRRPARRGLLPDDEEEDAPDVAAERPPLDAPAGRPPPIAVPPPPPETRPVMEDFVFTPGRSARPTRQKRETNPWVLRAGVAILAVAAAIVMFFALRPESAPEKPRVLPITVTSTPPVTPKATATAAPAPAGTPMTVVSSNLSKNPATHSYTVSATVLNPMDVAARNIRVDMTVFDSAGHTVATQTRTIESLGSGATASVSASGPYSAAATPTRVTVRAAAAQLSS